MRLSGVARVKVFSPAARAAGGVKVASLAAPDPVDHSSSAYVVGGVPRVLTVTSAWVRLADWVPVVNCV